VISGCTRVSAVEVQKVGNLHRSLVFSASKADERLDRMSDAGLETAAARPDEGVAERRTSGDRSARVTLKRGEAEELR